MKVIFENKEKALIAEKLKKYFYQQNDKKSYIENDKDEICFEKISNLVKLDKITIEEESRLGGDILTFVEYAINVISTCLNLFYLETSQDEEEEI